MIKLGYVYDVFGTLMIVIGAFSWRDRSNRRRHTTGMFWVLLGISVLFADWMPPMYLGLLVVAMILIAGFGGVGRGSHEALPDETQQSYAKRFGHQLFVPALLIPFITMLGSFWLKNATIHGMPLIEPKNATLVSLGVACFVAATAALLLTRRGVSTAIEETRRLLDDLGWTMLLPQLLAVLGALFAVAGVGDAVGHVLGWAVPAQSRFLAVAVYCIGMALFTMVMGNAFAAFPVMTLAIGLPVLVNIHGCNPAVMAAIGMYSGYCGTLMTPMAANFNIVPAALLNLSDRNAVIKAQVPTALTLLACNVILMFFLGFL
jgi:uncharacterized membrane protein